MAFLARADYDTVVVGVLVNHVLADPLAPITSKLHKQLPISRALGFGFLVRCRRCLLRRYIFQFFLYNEFKPSNPNTKQKQ